jgi:hypothetical protein
VLGKIPKSYTPFSILFHDRVLEEIDFGNVRAESTGHVTIVAASCFPAWTGLYWIVRVAVSLRFGMHAGRLQCSIEKTKCGPGMHVMCRMSIPYIRPLFTSAIIFRVMAARCGSGEAGSGAGKGGGGGGTIRDAGGAFGKMEAAHEEQYFRKLVRSWRFR